MHDSIVYKKIVDYLFEYCKENKISKITYLEVMVNQNKKINSISLLNYLIDEIPELVNYDTIIRVNLGDSDQLPGIVKRIEGINNETLRD